MLENRGKPPKVLWRWAVDSDEPPETNAPITLAGTVVGEITSAAPGPDGVRALGFLKRGHQTDGPEKFIIGGAPAQAVGPVEEGPGVCPRPK